jgi:subtilisin family serine protease
VSGNLPNRSRPRTWRGMALVSLIVACGVLTALPPAAADEPQSVYDAQWALHNADTDKLWAVSKGSGVTVAVVDSGVHASHPDLRGRVVPGGDFGDGGTVDGTHDIGGDRGHGTEVASLIAGTGRNYREHGLFGLAPEAKILSFGAYRDRAPDPAGVAKSVRAAVARGAGVLVIPAVGVDDGGVASAVRHAISRDVVVVSGTGETPESTASARSTALPGVVTVAALDRQGQVWPTGREQTAALGAPGAEILAAASDGTYWTGSGSDLAASWVAGVVALIRSANPGWSAAQTIQKVVDTARTGSGCGDACEYGVVDPVRAVTDTARPTASRNPLVEPAAPPRAEPESPFAGVPADRVLLFVGSALAALVLYVAVFALFIRRQHGRRGQTGGAEG